MKDTSTRIGIGSAYCYCKRIFESPELKALTAFMFMLLFSAQIFAQSRVVTGTVTDSKGEPLPGVTVKVKGSSTGATTTPEGKFSLRIPGDQAVVAFSYLGFTTQEISVGKKTSLSVALKEDATSLKEVVVNIAYGSAKKTDLTGSVAVVKMEDVLKAPVPTIDQALAGRVAGVQIVSPDGQPGGVADIAIRGTGSITSSSSPLYVVDGFPQEDSPLGTLSNNDIESITVLKDASSTAIYGARGANGVVVITTKRGSAGKPKIAYNGLSGAQKVFNKLELMSPYDFVRLQNDINSGYARGVYFTNGRTLESYRNIEGIDWQDKVFQTAPFSNHTLSLSGKNGGTNYFISGNYVDQKGIIIASGFKRYQGRINLDQEVSKKFKVGIVSNYSATKSYGNQPSTQSQGLSGAQGTQNNLSFNLMQNIWTYRPVNGSGDLSSLETDFQDDEAGDRDLDRLNPYIIAQNTINDTYVNTLQANSYAEVKILKDFKLRSTAGITYNTNRREFFNNSLSRGGSPFTNQGSLNGMNGGINSSNSFSFLNENTLTYDKKIRKDHSISALVGFTNQLSSSKANSFSAVQIPNEALGVSGLEEGTPFGQGSSSSENRLVSLLGRVNYNYKSKYLLTATMRGDASSKFYEGNKWGYFPSGAIAWRVSEEEFLKNIKAISNAKLKISYGVTGNNRVGDYAYASQIALSGSGTGTRTSFNNTVITGAVPTKMFTPDVRWETSATLDAGLELGLFRDRISIETDYYRKKTKDLLLVSNVPSSLGFNTTLENIGDIQNEGFEFSFNTSNVQSRNFTWTSSFNISFNKNKVLRLARNQDVREEFGASTTFSTDFANQALYIAQIGKPVASFYGYVYDGLYRLADFDIIQNGTTTNYRLKANIPYFNNATTPQPGDIKFKDLNGDGIINNDDYAVIGNPYPKHFGGLSNNFTYKGFDLNVFLQWSYGNEVFNGNRVALEGQSTGDARGLGLNMLASYADYWTPTNDDATQPRALVTAFGQRAFSSRFIEDASFLRLKTVALGYSIPSKIVNKLGMSTAKVFVSGQNLKTWTKYQGPDPEVSTKSSPTTPGFDFSAYPRTRVFVLGANIIF